jgi:hypothetical protein
MTKPRKPSNVIPLRRRPLRAPPNYDARVSDLFARLVEDQVWQDLLDLTIGDLIGDALIGYLDSSDEEILAAVQFRVITALNDLKYASREPAVRVIHEDEDEDDD